MYAKFLAMMIALLMLWTPALAEEAASPILVDRINAPAVNADFAFPADAPLLEVIFPQILNCDAIFLRCGGETILVDCATQGQAVRIVNMCKQLGITHIDRLINTHPHEDHIGGLRDLLKAVTIGEMWICFPVDYNTHMKKAVGYAQKAGVSIHTFQDGDAFALGGATIEVWKLEGGKDQLNDCSAQLFVTYGERTFLLAADLQSEGQKALVERLGDRLDADILKYPHHGIEVLEEAYRAAVSPLFLVVTNNHRKTAGWKAITKGDLPYAYTVPGFITLTTDGQTWLVDRNPSEVKY